MDSKITNKIAANKESTRVNLMLIIYTNYNVYLSETKVNTNRNDIEF